MKAFNPTPAARLAATLMAIGGTFLAKSVVTMLIVWLGVLVPLTAAAGIFRHHASFILAILTPIALALLLVWGWLVGAPPGAMLGSSPEEGIRFALLVTLRIALLGGICQLSLLTIPHDRLISTFRGWGLKGEGLVIALGTFALVPELKLRAEQVITARYARGLVPNRTPIAGLRQIAYLLRPLVAWILRSAIQRAEIWHQQGLLSRMLNTPSHQQNGSAAGSILYVTLALSWLVYNIF